MGAGSLANYIPYAALIDEGIIICKDGSLLRSFRAEPYDLSYQDVSAAYTHIRNVSDIFRTISELPYIVYTDCQIKEDRRLRRYCSEDAPEPSRVFEKHREDMLPFFSAEVYITFLLKPPPDKFSPGRLIFGSGGQSGDNHVLQSQLEDFKKAMEQIGNMLKGTYRTARPLGSGELLTYLHGTFSDTEHTVTPPESSFFYLDHYLADGILYPDVISKFNDTYIATLSIHLWPGKTSAAFMSNLITFPMVFRMVTSFEFITKEKARGRIKADRKTHFKKRKGVGQIAFDAASKTESELQDTDMLSMASDASQALSLLSDGYTTFGYLTCTILLMDRDYARLQKNLREVQSFVQNDHFICKIETLNNPLAYLGGIPGNYTLNAKKYTVSTQNLAHFFPLSSPWEGTAYDDHLYDLYKSRYDIEIDAPFLNAVTSFARRPFNVNLNYKECGHTLFVGPTGMGKSVGLNMMALAALKFPYSQVISFDKGASCRNVCLKCGGVFLEFDDTEESLKLNPFFDIDSTEKAAQISNLLISYLKAKGIPLPPADEQKIYEAVESLRTMPVENRGFETFTSAVQNSDGRIAFQPFIDGEHANLFKNGEDSIRYRRWIAFEMEWLMTNKPGEIVEFVLNYLFIVINRFLDGNFKFITLDEAWVYIRNKTFCNIIEDILRTWRKKHAYAVLTTQNVNDAFHSPIYTTIQSSCYTRILTPNPRASKHENIEFYKSLDMSEYDIFILEKTAKPNRDYLFINPLGKQFFSFNLSKEELDLLKIPMEKEEEAGPDLSGVQEDRERETYMDFLDDLDSPLKEV
jgi:type IV secretion system protein VirB4